MKLLCLLRTDCSQLFRIETVNTGFMVKRMVYRDQAVRLELVRLLVIVMGMN